MIDNLIAKAQAVSLDLAVPDALDRMTGPPDRMEAKGVGFLQTVRDAYLREARADAARWRVLDASAAPDVVAQAAIAALPPAEA